MSLHIFSHIERVDTFIFSTWFQLLCLFVSKRCCACAYTVKDMRQFQIILIVAEMFKDIQMRRRSNKKYIFGSIIWVQIKIEINLANVMTTADLLYLTETMVCWKF